MATAKRQVKPRVKSFDEYKAIKDEIVEISEQRFENILNKKFEYFEDKINSKLDQRFKTVYWILGAFITIYIATYSILINILLKKP